MELNIDHVTIAGADLQTLSGTFVDAGFSPTYGGTHSNGVTHMSLVRFQDGSYIELISTTNSDSTSPWWGASIHGNGGPCGWAINVDDIDTASETLRDRGVVVKGPRKYFRERSDGTLIEWELSFLGEGEPGTVLPFLISDHTPRELRIEPNHGVTEKDMVGLDTVVLGVADLEKATKHITTAFNLDEPKGGQFPLINASTATFSGTPVTLAEPRGDGWFAKRLSKFGPQPTAYILQGDATVPEAYDVATQGTLGDRTIDWLSLTEPIGNPYIGVANSER